MPYVDEIEEFMVRILGMTGTGVTDNFMQQIIREAIEKWDAWKIVQHGRKNVRTMRQSKLPMREGHGTEC